MRNRLVILMAFAALFSIPACGGSVIGALTGSGSHNPADVTIPSQILGLQVKSEDISKKVGAAKRPYIDNIALMSLRENDLVRATFQISRFNALASPNSPTFRNSIIGLLGSSRPQQVKVEGTTVYVTTGTDQSIFIWFAGRGFFVLTTHRQYEFPRTLVRRLIEVGPKL